ncbi:sensor histidine kinase [Dyadobacter sp. 3J3]|uniref:sensor histidine kinase n=1 Tax=Dyadobacter sp. 3J3 TaxID=2606600 RepID=UPI0013570190|nr:sensor histidine kinase [Dyadobacter sp. 3J3]
MKLATLSLLNRTLSEHSLSLITRFLFGTSLILIIALSYSYHEINQEQNNYSEKVNQTQRVISVLHQVSSAMYETTYHTNSYLFLKDTAYVNKTLAALQTIFPLTLKLDTLVAENRAQQKRLSALRDHYIQFDKYTKRLIKGGSSSDPALVFVLSKRKNSEVDSMMKLIVQMDHVEDQLMFTRLRSRENYTAQVFRYNWIIMVVAIVFLSSAFVLLDRELRRNKFYRVDLENKIENLNRSNSELEQFAYVASHDLQEPLRKIRSFSDRIITKYQNEVSGEISTMLGKIDGSAQRMQLLINDLLSFSRIVKTGTEAKTLNLNMALSDARSNLAQMILENKAIIHAENLPTIEGYGSQMVQLFQNLLSNSLKYHQENLPPVIYITHRVVAGDIIPGIKPSHSDIHFHQIKISDNGIGFKEEFAEKIFIIFKRLHGQHEFAGTGIGLAICKRVISNHNGYIFAESTEGNGANFYIYLPSESLLN